MPDLGTRFAEAFAAKDRDGLLGNWVEPSDTAHAAWMTVPAVLVRRVALDLMVPACGLRP